MKTIVVAKAILLDKAGDALLLRRSNTHPTMPHAPDFPGGEVEQGEEIAQALAREIKEETGLDVSPSSCRLLYAGTHVQDGVSFTHLLFVVKISNAKPTIKLSWEHDDFSWVKPEDLPGVEAKFNSFAKAALAHIRKHNLLGDL
jgi:8-oxo-dGTP diphosphatase